MSSASTLHRIVIVGGGAGGLELATQLGNSLGKQQRAQIILVDHQLTHLWKPLWHEVAAGTLMTSENELSYIVHAYLHHFEFQYGSFLKLDKQHKQITLAAVTNQQQLVLPERTLAYDTLVLALGSVSHDFDIPGVEEHCYTLDSYQDCQHFQQQFLQQLMRLQEQQQQELTIAIVGGGATGVELAAELQFACEQALNYKHKPKPVSYNIAISLIESAPRLLAGLPEKISLATQQELARRNIQVVLDEQVSEITPEAIHTKSGRVIPALLKVWAAGIKASPFLTTLGLATNQRNQLLVKQTLQTTLDENIFAFGDCAACPQPNSDRLVPPRAQAAHQQAHLLANSLTRQLQGKALLPYYYRDYGSLITLSRHNTFGNLMGKLLGDIMLEGKLARLVYLSLYRKHQAALYGWWRVALLSLAQFLTKPLRPRLKLH
ncbi:MAG: ndh [Gammaproteobacteria bacterium]|jgi:NADH dehydrogenase|nr:ndh [Gammaproteobacteria bacterium]